MNTLIRPSDFKLFNSDIFSPWSNGWDDVLPTLRSGVASTPSVRLPAVDIKETEGDYQLTADLPGIDKNDLEVSVKENVLKIAVSSEKESKEESDGRVIRRERYQGTFRRSFKLNDLADEQNIQASYKDGVLNVVVPKKASVEAKQIDVAVH